MRSEKTPEVIKTASTAGAAAGALSFGAGLLFLKGAATMALPTIMSATGTVVSGVGTIHGALTITVATFATAPIALPVLTVGAVAGAVGAYAYSLRK